MINIDMFFFCCGWLCICNHREKRIGFNQHFILSGGIGGRETGTRNVSKLLKNGYSDGPQNK